jgi:hypothetical protein
LPRGDSERSDRGRVKFSKRIASVVRAERSFLKPAEKAIGFFIRIPDLHVFGSRQRHRLIKPLSVRKPGETIFTNVQQLSAGSAPTD